MDWNTPCDFIQIRGHDRGTNYYINIARTKFLQTHKYFGNLNRSNNTPEITDWKRKSDSYFCIRHPCDFAADPVRNAGCSHPHHADPALRRCILVESLSLS
eukprot:gene19638-biopygen6215